jgi:peptidoglycan/LPS O-acetylase OafA/YrhL
MPGTERAELCAPAGNRRYRPDIQGLRGLAVLLVVAFHCGLPGFTGGFVGVDVFFVLSGYLITGLLIAEIHESGKLDLLEFYARRVRRLLPASALAIAVTLLVAAAMLAPQEVVFAGRAGRAAAVYLSNLFFSRNAADYFAPNVRTNPLLHTWSLAVEEQFYFFWPLLILLGLRFCRSVRGLAAVEAAVTLSSFLACLWWTANGGTFAFYQLPARAWEFGIGGLAVLVPPKSLRLSSIGRQALGWWGIFGILLSAVCISDVRNFPGWMALVPVAGTAIVLIASTGEACAQEVPMLRWRPLEVLGKLSYSWYLWHWPLLVFAVALFPSVGIAGKVVVAAASLALSAATHYLVENPIRFHPFLVARPALCVGLAAGLTAFSSIAANLSVRFGARLSNAPEMKAITKAVADISSLPRERCVALGQSAVLKTCVFGRPSSALNIVLFGDSHAIQWFNPLLRIAESRGWTLTTMVKSGCPAADINPPGFDTGFAAGCAAWRDRAIHRILTHRPDLVFAASAAVYHVSIEDWRAATRRTFVALNDAGVDVAAMRDTPIAGFDIPTCLARSLRLFHIRRVCEVERATALDPSIFEAEKSAARGLANVHFLDLTGRLCRTDTCWVTVDGEPIYRDSNHLTGRAAERLAPALESELVPIVMPWAYAKPSSYR